MMVLLRNKCIFCGGGDTQTLLAVKFLFELYAHSRCGNAKMNHYEPPDETFTI